MKYILITTQVYAGGTLTNTSGIPEPNRLGLFVLGKDGWLPWVQVEGQTNCTDLDLCPILSFPSWYKAWEKACTLQVGAVMEVDTEHPAPGALYSSAPVHRHYKTL